MKPDPNRNNTFQSVKFGLLGVFCLSLTFSQWGCAKMSSLSSELPKVRTSIPNEASSARQEIRRLQLWIKRNMQQSNSDVGVVKTTRRRRRSTAGTDSRIESYKPGRTYPSPSPKPVQPSPPPSAREPQNVRPMAKTMRRPRRRPRPYRRRLTPCQRLCRASRGICYASHRICRIATRFPTRRSFQVACRRSSNDCQISQRRCRKCR